MVPLCQELPPIPTADSCQHTELMRRRNGQNGGWRNVDATLSCSRMVEPTNSIAKWTCLICLQHHDTVMEAITSAIMCNAAVRHVPQIALLVECTQAIDLFRIDQNLLR